MSYRAEVSWSGEEFFNRLLKESRYVFVAFNQTTPDLKLENRGFFDLPGMQFVVVDSDSFWGFNFLDS